MISAVVTGKKIIFADSDLLSEDMGNYPANYCSGRSVLNGKLFMSLSPKKTPSTYHSIIQIKKILRGVHNAEK